MKFGILLDPVFPPSELIMLCKQIEKSGFNSLWYPDEKFFRDCYIGLSLAAHHTTKLSLGPCVTDPYLRHPILTAASISTLAELAPKRVWLGIGAGGRGLSNVQIERKSPSTAIREAIYVIRKLLTGESVDFHGNVISLNDRALDFFVNDNIPIFIGTGHGHSIQKLAGEIADGVMVANYSYIPALQKVLSRVEEGTLKGNRELSNIYKIYRVDVAINEEPKKARQAIAPKVLSSVRSSYPNLSSLVDLPDFTLSSELLKVLPLKDYRSKEFYADPERAATLLPADLINYLSICGTFDEVSEKINAVKNLGIFDEITFRPVVCKGQTMSEVIKALTQIIE